MRFATSELAGSAEMKEKSTVLQLRDVHPLHPRLDLTEDVIRLLRGQAARDEPAHEQVASSW